MSDEDRFYREHPGDKVLWLNKDSGAGKFLFSLDGKKIYNLFRDYPHNMTPEEVRIFDRENPLWAEFFKDRKEKKP